VLLPLRIRLIEDRQEDGPVGRSLRDRIRNKVARDPDLGSPDCRQVRDDEGDQHDYINHC